MKFVLPIFAFLILTFSAHAQKPTLTPPPFLMAVEDTFSISGRGVIATGKIERGIIKTSDTVEIVGLKAAKTTTVAGIEMSGKMVSEAKAGDIIGILLRGVEKSDVERGQVLARPGTVKTYTKIKATIDLLESHERGRSTPMNDKYRGLFNIRTSGFSGVITLPAGIRSVAPGKKGTAVEIAFEKPVPIENGQAFGIREASRTIGNGMVTALIQ
jgi:elongation factor Tu